MAYYLKPSSSQPSRHTLDITVPPEDSGRTMQNWNLLVDPYSRICPWYHLYRIVFCYLATWHLLLSLMGRDGHFARESHSTWRHVSVLCRAVSLGTTSGSSSECLHLTWTKDERDPGAGRSSKRQEDGCSLWGQQQPGSKSGEQSWRYKLQLVNQQAVKQS